MKARIPPKTKSAKTDSNRRNAKAILEKETRAIRARNKPYRKARATFMRQRKAVLTPEAIKKAKPILERGRKEFARAALKLDGQVDAVAEAKTQTRKSLERALLLQALSHGARANNGLGSLGGTELSHAESPIPSFTPITFGFTTKDAFLKGERIQIFAGSSIYLGSDLDDMNSFGEATLTWQLLNISVRV